MAAHEAHPKETNGAPEAEKPIAVSSSPNLLYHVSKSTVVAVPIKFNCQVCQARRRDYNSTCQYCIPYSQIPSKVVVP